MAAMAAMTAMVAMVMAVGSGCVATRVVPETEYTVYQYDNGDDYVSEGMYRIVGRNGRIGYYDAEHGRVAIAPRFAFGFPFDGGKARVTDGGELREVDGSGGEYHYWHSDEWYYVDKNGNVVK